MQSGALLLTRRPLRPLSVMAVLPSLPGLLIALLPKCPLCWVALLAAAEIRPAVAGNLLFPVQFLCVLPMAAWLAIRARKGGTWLPFFLYIPAAGMLLLARLCPRSAYAFIAAMLLLATAALWSARARPLRRSALRAPCC